MKFKALFLIFNLVLVISFVLIFFAPLIFMGEESFLLVLRQNLIIIIIFLVFLIAFNTYFLLNLRFYSYLEKEDWNGLITFLENCIFNKSSTRSSYIKILINSYLVTSHIEAIKKLEKHLMQKRPASVQKFSTQFSIPYLLSNKPEEAENFFNSLLEMAGTHNRDWIRWNYAFALLQQNKEEQGKNCLLSLLHMTNDIVLLLLTLYLLDSYSARDHEVKEQVAVTLKALREKYTKEALQKALEISKKKNIEVLMLSQIIRDASAWFFKEKAEKEPAEVPSTQE
ncbi:MAG: hypothetical protein JW822_02265 [Spirochaetales bacterium]|nr:hypothetical protein [Spirochaetales bacterium]